MTRNANAPGDPGHSKQEASTLIYEECGRRCKWTANSKDKLSGLAISATLFAGNLFP